MMLFIRPGKNGASEDRHLEEWEVGSTISDPTAESVALRKVDWHILPLIFLLYMFSFLDRYAMSFGRHRQDFC